MNKTIRDARERSLFRAVFVTICAIAGTSGCFSDPMPVKSMAELARPPIRMQPGAKLSPVALTRVVINIPRGTQISGETTCLWPTAAVHWNSGRTAFKPDEFAERFVHALKAANYNVAGDPTILFTASENKVAPRYRVGARIDRIAMNICHHSDWFERAPESGEGAVRVAWQVQDTVDERIVYETTTEGGSKIAYGDARMDARVDLIFDAFESAAKSLAADQGFYKLVSAMPVTSASLQHPAGAPLRFSPATTFRGPIQTQMDYIRLGVVTLSVADQHGSGFFISPTLILTNNHVVAGHDIVRVTLITGRKLLGEVIRNHVQRDVALVSVEAGGHSPLPLRRHRVAKIGEEVYAIGTPLDRAFSGTVTKGIVSAFRSNAAGLEDIQADVRINPGNSGGPLLDASGNVVGITYAAIRATGEGSTGLNLFIPIRDALDKLGLAPDDAMTGGPAAAN